MLSPLRRGIITALSLLAAGCSSTSGESKRLASITITPRNAVIGASSSVAFRLTGTYEDGSSRDVTGAQWQSSLPGVATIDASGTANGKVAGETMIRANVDGFRDSTTLLVSATSAPGPLRVSTVNPRYFADPSGRVIYLTGSHYWKNVQDDGTTNPPPAFDNVGYLDFLQQHNHNFTRLWVWEQARWSSETSVDHFFSPTLYVRTGTDTALDGGAKFDLNQINPAYLARLRQRVIDAGARGIYVSVMLFDGWSLGYKGNSNSANPWLAHPFNGSNNINGIDGDTNGDGNGVEIQTLSIPAVTALQEAYVKAVIDAVNDLDNVIYEVSNESDPSADQW
ncbi:MAG TPA: Ig-like domain-containing protein, partial [Gemmatimonadaceae bacterium]|nr:Ig-like domain-containing protein [Gemmatimonadaceae bacterium]